MGVPCRGIDMSWLNNYDIKSSCNADLQSGDEQDEKDELCEEDTREVDTKGLLESFFGIDLGMGI